MLHLLNLLLKPRLLFRRHGLLERFHAFGIHTRRTARSPAGTTGPPRTHLFFERLLFRCQHAGNLLVELPKAVAGTSIRGTFHRTMVPKYLGHLFRLFGAQFQPILKLFGSFPGMNLRPFLRVQFEFGRPLDAPSAKAGIDQIADKRKLRNSSLGRLVP